MSVVSRRWARQLSYDLRELGSQAVDALVIAATAFSVLDNVGCGYCAVAGACQPLNYFREGFVVVDELVDLLADVGREALDTVAAGRGGKRLSRSRSKSRNGNGSGSKTWIDGAGMRGSVARKNIPRIKSCQMRI